MTDRSKIEWTDYTFNPWIGCTEVSPGCDNCYAREMAKHRGWARWGNHPRHRTAPSTWKKPLKWNREAERDGVRRKVFCASLADVFDNHGSITSGWHGDLWYLIDQTPYLDWLLLTKRPQNIKKMLPESYGMPEWGDGWKNVWLGTTVENQTEAERRVPTLLEVPAKTHFLSCEPLLAPLELNAINVGNESWDVLSGTVWPCSGDYEYDDKNKYEDGSKLIDWVICGGESGPHARIMDPKWARDLRDQCTSNSTPFFMKQMTKKAPIPADLMVRQFPNITVTKAN